MTVRAGAAAFLILSLLLITGAKAQNWTQYSPGDGGYTIDMPGQWSTETKDVQTDVGTIKMHMATVDGGAVVYMSIYSQFPQDHIDNTPPETLLDNARNGAIKNINGKLLKEARIKLSGHPGRHLVVDTKDTRVSQRLVLAGTILIQAIFVGAAGEETKPDAQRFFNSLAVASR